MLEMLAFWEAKKLRGSTSLSRESPQACEVPAIHKISCVTVFRQCTTLL